MADAVPPVPGGHRLGLRLIAAFEAAKGLLVLAAGSGVLVALHSDVQAVAERLVLHLHLNPASRLPRIFLRLAAQTTSARLRWIAVGALLYALLRFAEAAGLWTGRRWAEWLGVWSGLVYVPFELRGMLLRPGLEPLTALVVNLAVVLYLFARLRPAADGPSAGTS